MVGAVAGRRRGGGGRGGRVGGGRAEQRAVDTSYSTFIQQRVKGARAGGGDLGVHGQGMRRQGSGGGAVFGMYNDGMGDAYVTMIRDISG